MDVIEWAVSSVGIKRVPIHIGWMLMWVAAIAGAAVRRRPRDFMSATLREIQEFAGDRRRSRARR